MSQTSGPNWEIGFHEEKKIRGFSAIAKNGDKFILRPEDTFWNVYRYVHGDRFRVVPFQMEVSPQQLDDLIEEHEWSVGDSGNGVFWYSHDMICRTTPASAWSA